MKRGILLVSLALCSALAFALPSTEDVQSAVKAGNYGQAETMMQEVVTAKPQSARAHYIYAEILAHEGKFEDALSQAHSAQSIDPALGFTDPQKFRSFEQLLEREQHPGAAPSPRVIDQTAPVVHSAQHAAGGVPGWVWGAGIAIVMFLIFRAVMRRAGGMGRNNGGGGYGGAPVWNGPNGGGYGMNGGMMGGAPSAGGSMLRTGLAAAGGVAAGMLAERYLEGRNHDGAVDQGTGFNGLQPDVSNDAASQLESRPVDFGSGGGWGGDGSSTDFGGGGSSSSDDGGGW